MVVSIVLFLVGGIAGFIDAIAGGGGVLTLPALLTVGLDPLAALATNKGQSVFGSAMSLQRFSRSPLLDRQRAWPSFVAGLIGAAVGVMLMSKLPREVLAPLVIGLLAFVAVLMAFHRPQEANQPPRQRSLWLATLVAVLLGGYDGFFGPGTGTFLILAYAYLWRERLDAASANAKVVNFASNLASMATFAMMGLIRWHYALPMAAGQLIGGYLGAHLTIRVGRELVRYVVLVVSLALIAKLIWGLVFP